MTAALTTPARQHPQPVPGYSDALITTCAFAGWDNPLASSEWSTS
ncbi:MAG: hypothetical protein ACRDQ5_21820 [Sciscionella sp.]